MKTIAAVFLIAAMAGSVQAQQGPSPTNIAIQVNNAINTMALELEQLRQTNSTLQQEVLKAQARIKELEGKENK
jgi:TolA-binding protein